MGTRPSPKSSKHTLLPLLNFRSCDSTPGLSHYRRLGAFHEKADPCQELFSIALRDFSFFPFSQAASVATLPSALLVERFSLGASWVFLIQQVLLSSTRRPLPSFVREVWASRQTQSPELGGRARLFGYKLSTPLRGSLSGYCAAVRRPLH